MTQRTYFNPVGLELVKVSIKPLEVGLKCQNEVFFIIRHFKSEVKEPNNEFCAFAKLAKQPTLEQTI